jgi:hypothetical protein
MAMDVVGEEKLQLDSVISKLKNTKVTEKNTVDALNVNKKKFAKAKFKGKCHACGRIVGHIKKDCYAAKETALMVTNQKEESTKAWIIDSGASVHMTGDPSLLFNIRQNNKIKVVIPNGLEISSSRIGSAKLGNISLKKVFLVPGLKRNLLSVSELPKTYDVVFKQNAFYIHGQKIPLNEY